MNKQDIVHFIDQLFPVTKSRAATVAGHTAHTIFSVWTLGQLPVEVLCASQTLHGQRCCDRDTATQAHLAAFRPQGNLSFPEQLYQCFSREKGFQRALPGQSKLPGSCGSFLCLQLTWQTGRSRGLLLLCLSQRWKWYAQSSSGISREILQGGEHFWCPAMCCWELFSASVWPMAHFHFPSIRR